MRKKQNYQWNHLTMGTCYYPEQWDQSLWKDDLKRMKDNGIEVIRIGEFAWSKIEPREGEFSFELSKRWNSISSWNAQTCQL